MADKTKIEWSDATRNIITGCTLVDEGCRNCYAAHLIASWPAIGNHPSRKGLARKNAGGAKFTGEVRFNEQWLDQPLRWKKPRRIFVCAHGDLFHEAVPDEWIDRVFAVMALAPQHTFQVLTKRPDRAREYLLSKWDLEGGGVMSRGNVVATAALVMDTARFMGNGKMLKGWPLPNVWLGTSASDQASADLRIPPLLAAPAAVRFLSAEPLLGQMDLTKWIGTEPYLPGASTYLDCDGFERQDIGGGIIDGIDLVIVGGESGPRARPMQPDWARSLRDQCNAAGVAFHFKQWGEYSPENPSARSFIDHSFGGKGPGMYRVGKKAAGRMLDGRTWDQMPEVSQ